MVLTVSCTQTTIILFLLYLFLKHRLNTNQLHDEMRFFSFHAQKQARMVEGDNVISLEAASRKARLLVSSLGSIWGDSDGRSRGILLFSINFDQSEKPLITHSHINLSFDCHPRSAECYKFGRNDCRDKQDQQRRHKGTVMYSFPSHMEGALSELPMTQHDQLEFTPTLSVPVVGTITGLSYRCQDPCCRQRNPPYGKGALPCRGRLVGAVFSDILLCHSRGPPLIHGKGALQPCERFEGAALSDIKGRGDSQLKGRKKEGQVQLCIILESITSTLLSRSCTACPHSLCLYSTTLARLNKTHSEKPLGFGVQYEPTS